MRISSVTAIILLMVLLPLPAISAGVPYMFHLDHKDGLCNDYIRDICQDGHGYVWVATSDGLNRFDGRSFSRFTKETSGLTSNELNCVLADPADPDIMWISTRHDGLCRYDHKTGLISGFEGELSTTDVPSLSVNSKGKIWVVHYHYLPELLDPATGELTPLYNDFPQGFIRPIWCAVEDVHGRYLYIGSEGHGMTRVNLRDKSFKNYEYVEGHTDGLCGRTVYNIHIDSHGSVWMGTDMGVSVFEPESETFTNIVHSHAPGSILPGMVRCIREMSNGDIWFGTSEGGVSVLSATNRLNRDYTFVNMTPKLRPNSEESLSSPFVNAIYEDSYGNKWIGNFSSGVDVVSYQEPFFSCAEPFRTMRWKRRYWPVWGIATDLDGNVWMGGEDEIVRVDGFEAEHVSLPTASKGLSAMVRAIYPDRYGRLWIGTSNSGAYTYDPLRKELTDVIMPEKEVRCLLEDCDGSILIGTHSGVYRSTDGLKATPVANINSGLKDLYVLSMMRDNEHRLWVGTFGKGLMIFSPQGTLVWTVDNGNGLPSNTVNSLCMDSRGYMWLATREGAVRISTGDYTDTMVIGRDEGLLNSDVKSIEEDSDGNIWLSTSNGIALYNVHDKRVSVYERAYLSQLSAFTEGASTVDRNGRLYFGSLNGYTCFNPINLSHDASLTRNSSITLTGITAHDRNASDQNLEIEIPVNSDHITLPYNYSTFTLRFNNLDITQAANSDYSYNMKGVNEVWTKVTDDNGAIYRNLHPGTYEFQVRHRMNGREWSDPQTLASITITPPAYLTWWAKMLYAIILFTLVSFFTYFYKHKLELEKNLAVEKENSKNIRSLNEERLIFFTNITHELRTPLSLIIGPIEDLVNDASLSDVHRKRLHTIRTSSMRLLNLINGILEFRKTETQNRKLEVVHGDIANYVREIGLRFKELNNNANVNIVIDVAGMEGHDMFYDPEMVATIITNLMSNALKYTREGTVKMLLRPATDKGVRYVDLIVSDTGVGISPEALPHVFERYYQAENSRKTSGTGIGLALTKNLVELHEATITAESEPGVGSTFTVRFIMDNSYPNARHRELSEVSGQQGDSDSVSPMPDSVARLVLLVVEDDDDVRQYIAQSFTGDYDVLQATNGREGLEIIRSKMPDVVVSDIMMPEMDGIELCRTVKSEIATSHIPVILLTAKDSLLDREEGYDSGADSYITKPFSSNLLRARINNIMESRHKLTMSLLDMPHDDEHAPQCESLTCKPQETVAQPQVTDLSALDREFISKFRALVEDNMEMEEFDQTFLADRMCMSASTLYRKVKSIAGLTPNEFIRKIKLKRAAEIILKGDERVSISDIAFMTGFGSPAYFRRVFKKEYGVSPSEYTQQSASQTQVPD